MRFFIALELAEKNKEEIRALQEKLGIALPQVKLTDYKKLHFTIAFIGEHRDDIKEPLAQIINQATENIHPFAITPSFLDGFPRLHEPHTLFLGVKGDVDQLFFLQERIKDGLMKLHLEVDNRRFVPHIAVAKLFDSTLSLAKEEELEQLVISSNLSPIEVGSVKLFESVADEGTHIHNLLAEIRLI